MRHYDDRLEALANPTRVGPRIVDASTRVRVLVAVVAMCAGHGLSYLAFPVGRWMVEQDPTGDLDIIVLPELVGLGVQAVLFALTVAFGFMWLKPPGPRRAVGIAVVACWAVGFAGFVIGAEINKAWVNGTYG